jgi:hypothetical protein
VTTPCALKLIAGSEAAAKKPWLLPAPSSDLSKSSLIEAFQLPEFERAGPTMLPL